jgi:hypothetical protein
MIFDKKINMEISQIEKEKIIKYLSAASYQMKIGKDIKK